MECPNLSLFESLIFVLRQMQKVALFPSHSEYMHIREAMGDKVQ